jgi:Helix-turn-helix domain
MEEKLRFIFEHERKESTMGELCIRFGISRETGYVLLRRFRHYGLRGLEELDRAPQRHPNKPVRRSSVLCWNCGRRICAGVRGS